MATAANFIAVVATVVATATDVAAATAGDPVAAATDAPAAAAAAVGDRIAAATDAISAAADAVGDTPPPTPHLSPRTLTSSPTLSQPSTPPPWLSPLRPTPPSWPLPPPST